MEKDDTINEIEELPVIIESHGSGNKNASSQFDVPYIESDVGKPKLDMIFLNLDEAFQFYNAYAKLVGFSVRQSSCRYDKEKIVKWKLYVCNKEGTTDNKTEIENGEVRRRHGHIRQNCRARMAVKRKADKSGWQVTLFEEMHNHEMTTPRRRHLLRSHREVSYAKKSLADTYSAANISTTHQMGVFELQVGGYENIGCTEQDLRNYERDKREEMRGHDADSLYEHFREKKELNPSFAYDIKVDDQNRLTHIFWADPFCRSSYCHLGDVISFDTTHVTNRYHFLCALFIGVNHHQQSIIHGCGFIRDETTDSFIWLLEKWLEAMPGDPPKAIITDQDPAMAKAILQVLPQTFHRLCAWHILNKVPEKLGKLDNYDAFKSRFKDLIWNSEYEKEFEADWLILLKEFELQDHEWLHMMYEIRQKWIPVYIKHIFFAGMSTTQRSESMNFVIKQYVNKKNSFSDFIIRFERGLARQRHRELMADDKSKSTMPKLKTPLAMEKEMANTLTRKVFFLFQDEIFNVMMYSADKKFVTNEIILFEVNKLEGNRRGRQVNYNSNTKHAICSCHKFEFEGIPCRHILCVLIHEKIVHLPQQYVLNRWTIAARESYIFDTACEKSKRNLSDDVAFRHLELSQLVSKIVDEGALSGESFEEVKDVCLQLLSRIREVNAKVGATTLFESQKGKRTKIITSTYLDPQVAKPKGSGKRIKSAIEKANVKPRICRGCKKSGHDLRTCPNVGR